VASEELRAAGFAAMEAVVGWALGMVEAKAPAARVWVGAGVTVACWVAGEAEHVAALVGPAAVMAAARAAVMAKGMGVAQEALVEMQAVVMAGERVGV